MTLVELLLIAIGLSMDAFAAAICLGLSKETSSNKNALIVGLYFGIFQALMPLIGYLLGSQFAHKITFIDHWIALVLLGIIGGKMLIDSFKKEETCEINTISLNYKKMLPLAIATSIDALAIGVSFAFLQVHIISAVCVIGIITMIISIIGMKLGCMWGAKIKSKAEFIGGCILIIIGIKIFIEHTFF